VRGSELLLRNMTIDLVSRIARVGRDWSSGGMTKTVRKSIDAAPESASKGKALWLVEHESQGADFLKLVPTA
jgi:hypothetical protein